MVRPARAAAGLTLLLAAALVAGCDVKNDPPGQRAQQDRQQSDTATQELPPLKPHPRVVVALAPGHEPPPGAVAAYGPGSEAEAFQLPSDAEVRQELTQLHASKLGGSGAYTDPFAH